MNRSPPALPMQRSILIPVGCRRVQKIRRTGSSPQELPAIPHPANSGIRRYIENPSEPPQFKPTHKRERGGGRPTFVCLHEPAESRPDRFRKHLEFGAALLLLKYEHRLAENADYAGRSVRGEFQL